MIGGKFFIFSYLDRIIDHVITDLKQPSYPKSGVTPHQLN